MKWATLVAGLMYCGINDINIVNFGKASVAQLDALVSVFRVLQFSSDFAGLNRQESRSDTTVVPKQNRFTVLHGSQR